MVFLDIAFWMISVKSTKQRLPATPKPNLKHTKRKLLRCETVWESQKLCVCVCVWEPAGRRCVTQALVQVCLVKWNPGIVYKQDFIFHVHSVTNSESQLCVQVLLQSSPVSVWECMCYCPIYEPLINWWEKYDQSVSLIFFKCQAAARRSLS